MLNRTAAYDAAITADARRVYLRAIVDISDPDKVLLPVTGSPEAPWSKKEQLHDYDMTAPPRRATLEKNRWMLDGSYQLFPAGYAIPGPVGYASAALCDASGVFNPPLTIQLNFTGVRILQDFSLYFSELPEDGVPEDFTVEVFCNDTVYFTQETTNNAAPSVRFRNFTVYDPTAIRVTVRKWSRPSRRVRAVEFVLGTFERWDGDGLEALSVSLQGQFSCLTLPYGTAELTMDNADRRFEPRKKDSLFQSIEERQGVDLYLGAGLPDGDVEYKKLGVFYQTGDGWKTSRNAMTMQWSLVDIIGLLQGRTFLPPSTLPTTLEGWLRALVSQLGNSSSRRYRVDPAYASLPVTANSVEDVTGKSCGDILRWACQATGTWPRAEQATGALCADPLWNEGSKITLDNLTDYPTMKANESLAALIFELADGNKTEYVISGNSTSSEKTVTIQNPFLHTQAQARTAARLILAQYGGNVLELTGRGDPSSEIGDVDTVWLDESSATTARRMTQTFQMENGVLQNCRSTLLQADGSYLWTGCAVIRESGQWTAPEGVTKLRIVLGQGGQGGGYGQDGFVYPSGNLPGQSVTAGEGERGIDGQGGAIWYGVIDCNEEQVFDVHLGAGGAPGSTYGAAGRTGEHTTFGAYSSEQGRVYENGYTDIANGQSFARTGVPAPLPGTGDGGRGGAGGEPGEGYWEQLFWDDGRPRGWDFIVTKEPGKGRPGVAGATGFAMVTWDIAET